MHGVEYNLRAKATTKRSSFIVIVMIIINVIKKRLVIPFLSSKFFCGTAWNGTKKGRPRNSLWRERDFNDETLKAKAR